jgi:hypothetical protein
MPDAVLTDAVGRPRSKVTLPGYLAGRAPHNKGMSYPADPPRVEEIIAVMRQAGENRHGLRIRAVIAVLWRGGLRISESLALSETDVDPERGSVLIRHGLCRIRHRPSRTNNPVVPCVPVHGVSVIATAPPSGSGTTSPVIACDPGTVNKGSGLDCPGERVLTVLRHESGTNFGHSI